MTALRLDNSSHSNAQYLEPASSLTAGLSDTGFCGTTFHTLDDYIL